MSECPRIEAEMPRVGDAAAGMARRPDCQDRVEARYHACLQAEALPWIARSGVPSRARGWEAAP
jgi:hypothetical protein